jgi:asparagine synthase (glutamine-hydrolysing)
MCGVAAIVGARVRRRDVEAMVASQRHRGPDAHGIYEDSAGGALLGHNRLSIIDLSAQGNQPMADSRGRLWVVFNGEIYNYRELRAELAGYPFQTRTDTEVLLAAFQRWGPGCLERLVGMFAFVVWDSEHRSLFAARDRFGVKPLFYHTDADGTLALASEIKALHVSGVPRSPDDRAWASYFAHGVQDASDRTFWKGVRSLPAGYHLEWRDGRTSVNRWYDISARVGVDDDARPLEEVQEEYTALLFESVRLRFRSDVPVGINLSGGLDSSTLLGVVQAVQGADSDAHAFTFATGDPRYDELPWVERMLTRTRHPLSVCHLSAADVPALASSVADSQDEPFGGIPTLAYARLFERARAEGVIVLLDGQGMDEQWAGYEYYHTARGGCP